MLKPGWKTSEGHLSLLTIGVAGFMLTKAGVTDECKDQILTQVVPAAMMAFTTATYAISRAIAKLRAPAAPVPAPTPTAVTPAADDAEDTTPPPV